MPYITSNPAYGRSLENITRAFLGDPGSDADVARAALLQAQREKTALEISKVQQEMQQRNALAGLVADYPNRVNAMQGPLPQGQTAQQAFGQTVYDQMAPDIASAMIGAGYDNPKMATVMSMLPGLSDAQRGRNYMAAGNVIGKDQYFSPEDRNANAVYDVSAGARAVRGNGDTIVPLSPLYEDTLASQAERDRAAAAKDNREATTGGKIPKMGAAETQLLLGGLSKSFGYEDGNQFLTDLNSDPALSAGLTQAAQQGWEQSGGNLMAAMGMAQQFLNSVPQPADTHWFSAQRRFEGAHPAAAVPPAMDPVEAELRRRGLLK